jgi:transcriptional regulator with XRE-family HTH domain
MGEIIPLRSDPVDSLRGDAQELFQRDRIQAARERRAAWGRDIRHRRLANGLTTRSLASQIGLASPGIVSAVEAGRGRLPEGSLHRWAEALGMEPVLFAATYLAAFEPDAAALVLPVRENLDVEGEAS